MPFTQRMIPLLQENRRRNSREWYNAHKDQFREYVQRPFYELVEALAPFLYKTDAEIVTVPRYCLSHVYRDTRFAKDKSTLYRENLWLTFKRSSKGRTPGPCFYFEVFPDFYRYGMGYYAAPPAVMAKYRACISSDPDAFMRIISELKTLSLDTEFYKRPFAGYCPEELRDWFMAKNVHVTVAREIGGLYSPSLADEVAAAFKQAAPLYRLLASLPDMPAAEPQTLPRRNTKDEW